MISHCYPTLYPRWCSHGDFPTRSPRLRHGSGFRQPLQLLDIMATCGCAADMISTWDSWESGTRNPRKCGDKSSHPEIVFLQKNSLKLGICLRIRKFYLITSGRLYITISNSEYKIININIFISRYIQYFIVNF